MSSSDSIRSSEERTKPMEIVAGEHACCRLLAFISLKMELSWRTTKVGKVQPKVGLDTTPENVVRREKWTNRGQKSERVEG
jgi:hypothetical protein